MTSERVILARLGREHFAFPIVAVREALDGAVVSPLPLLPNGVIGQCVHRGELLPVLDPLVVLGTATQDGAATLLVFVAARPFALPVDDVTDMVTVEDCARRAMPGGTDRGGMLDGLLAIDGLLAGAVDIATLRATADSLLTPATR